MGGEACVHEHIDLDRAAGDDGGDHEGEDAADAWVAPCEVRAEAVADAAEGGELDEELGETAEECADGEADHAIGVEAGGGAVVEDPCEAEAAGDGEDVEATAGHGWDGEDLFGVEHAHDESGEGDEQDEREHDLREAGGVFLFFGGPLVEEKADDRSGDEDPEEGDGAHDDGGEREDFVGEGPCGAVAFGFDLL